MVERRAVNAMVTGSSPVPGAAENMKIFAIYSVVKTDGKSERLKTFRKNYDELYELHVTLKQPVRINENEVNEVKQIFSRLDKPNSRIDVIFNKIRGDGKVLMLDAEENRTLMDLQKRISGLLKPYNSYVDGDTEQYEIDFKPHITVARNIDEQVISSVKEQLIKILPVEAFIDSLTLAIVDHISPEESLNPNNLTEIKF